MTRVGKWFRNLLERRLGQYEEGPEPPERLGSLAVAFANAHPRATRAEWAEFAKAAMGAAYRAGYVRGFEAVERDPAQQPWSGALPPDLVADRVDPDWRWRPAFAEGLVEPDFEVPAEAPLNRPGAGAPDSFYLGARPPRPWEQDEGGGAQGDGAEGGEHGDK